MAASAASRAFSKKLKSGLEIDTLDADIRFSHAADGRWARWKASRSVRRYHGSSVNSSLTFHDQSGCSSALAFDHGCTGTDAKADGERPDHSGLFVFWRWRAPDESGARHFHFRHLSNGKRKAAADACGGFSL